MEKLPTYLTQNVYNVKNDDYLSVDIKSKQGNTLFEIYYYGDLYELEGKKQPFIVDNYTQEDTCIPCKIVAKDIASAEEILLFDGYQHGYNGMFCDEFNPEDVQARTLTKYNIAPCKVHIKFGYSIDYEEEKEDYVDTNDNVTLINGNTITWEEVKRNGFDYISIVCETTNGEKTEIAALELA